MSVNGEMRQQSTTANMIVEVPMLVSDLSEFMTLLPGDEVATGIDRVGESRQNVGRTT